MSARAIIRIIILSLFLAVSGRYGYLLYQSWQNESFTHELCAAVGNFMETGSLRETYEGLQYGMIRAGRADACVNTLDNGRSYGPNCVDPKINYQTVICKAESNRGVRAQAMYPATSLFGRGLVVLWGLLSIVFSTLLMSARFAAGYFGRQVTEELRTRILHEPSCHQQGVVGQSVEWILEKAGILRDLKVQAQDFEERLKSFEAEALKESSLRLQKEAEIANANEYVEKIKRIRHDIRSPLSTLMAIQNELDSEDELVLSAFSSAVRGVRSLVEKLNNVESEELTPRLTVIEVLAEEAVDALRMKFKKQKQVSLNLSYNSQRLSPVFAIPDGILRIFENLLENAFDAVAPGGNIKVLVESDSAHCKVVVEDDGCGISPEVAAKLFAEGATFGKVNGTGLGLYHAKKNIEAWKGRIECKPSATETQFVITLPLVQTGVLFQGRPNEHQLMVVDDEMAAIAAFERGGFDIIEFRTSFAAGKELLAGERPQDTAILVDQDLGHGKLGTDLIAEVFGRGGVFLCTSDYDNPDVVRRAKEVGVSIIPKPLMLAARREVGKS